jgi:hypothetical protein
MALAAMFTQANRNLAVAASNGERYTPELGREAARKEAAAEALKTIGTPIMDPYPGMVVTCRRDRSECRVIYVGLDGTVLVEASYISRTWSGDLLSFSEEFTDSAQNARAMHEAWDGAVSRAEAMIGGVK